MVGMVRPGSANCGNGLNPKSKSNQIKHYIIVRPCWMLDVLETIHLIFWNTVVHQVAVVKLGVYNGGGNCFGDVKFKVGTDTAKSWGVAAPHWRAQRVS